MDKVNKLSLPVTILLAAIILGGFYYASETNKQKSIEKQQQIELQAKADQQTQRDQANALEVAQRSDCVFEAQDTATGQYKDFCTKDNYCTYKEGRYLTAQYDSAYRTCLQRKGLE